MALVDIDSLLSVVFPCAMLAHRGITILNGEKHTLSNEVAYEATSLLRHHSWETYKNADKAPFLYHLLEKQAEMRALEPLFPSISSRYLLSVCFSPFNDTTGESTY